MLEIFQSRALAASENMRVRMKLIQGLNQEPLFDLLCSGSHPWVLLPVGCCITSSFGSCGIVNELAHSNVYECTVSIYLKRLVLWTKGIPTILYQSITYAQFQQQVYDSYTIFLCNEGDQ